jgi:thiol-disulfide isomerase/thioredoxin
MVIKALALMSLGVLTLGCSADAGPSVGDAAPPLAAEAWLGGETVDPLKGDGLYVVEFWAMWCPPCRASIPHLVKLQNQYRDRNVTIIGVTAPTRGEARDMAAFQRKLEGFYKSNNINYRVAVDPSAGTHGKYGVRGIPAAFVVKNGKVLWKGHPMRGLDKAVADNAPPPEPKPVPVTPEPEPVAPEPEPAPPATKA